MRSFLTALLSTVLVLETLISSERYQCSGEPWPLNSTVSLTTTAASSGGVCEFKGNQTVNYVCEGRQLKSLKNTDIPNDELESFILRDTLVRCIEDGTFRNKFIRAITATNNELTAIEEGAFEGLQGLQLLDLRNNKISMTTDNLFRSFRPLTMLRNLRLDQNYISFRTGGEDIILKKDEDTSFLNDLEIFSIGDNTLGTLDASLIFQLGGGRSLSKISLNHAGLIYIKPGTFDRLTSLRALDVGSNTGLFSMSQPGSRAGDDSLVIKSPTQTKFRMTFLEGTQLSEYDLSANSLKLIPFEHLESVKDSLEKLDLSDNLIGDIGSPDGLRKDFPLMHKLVWLRMDNCRIWNIHPGSFSSLTSLEFLSLNRNPLVVFPYTVLRPSLKVLQLSGPLRHADPSLPPLDIPRNFSEDTNDTDTQRLKSLSINSFNLGQVTESTFSGLEGNTISNLNLSNCLIAGIQDGAFRSMKSLKGVSLAHSMGAGINLTVFLDIDDLETLDLTDVPILPNAQPQPDSSQYSLGNIKKLVLANSLVEADLLGKTLNFSKMPDLEELVLDHNSISTWASPMFKGNPNLKYFSMASSRSSIVLSNAMMDDLKGIQTLDLSLSDFICNDIIFDFYKMAENQANVVGWEGGNGYKCKDTNGNIKTFNQMLSDGIETDDGFPRPHTDRPSREITSILMPVIVGVSVSVVAVLLVIGFVRAVSSDNWHIRLQLLRLRIKAALASKGSSGYDDEDVGNPEAAVGGRFRFDAFISYCNEEKDWIEKELMDNLETKHGLRLCLHERDFQAGRPIIENIVKNLEQSRGCVIVLSRGYLESEWCTFESQVIQYMFNDRRRPLAVVIPTGADKAATSPGLTNAMQKIVSTWTYLDFSSSKAAKSQDLWKRLALTLSLQLAKKTHNTQQQDVDNG